MTLSIPLTVRIKTSKTDVHVEQQVRSLTFSSSVPGGFGSLNIVLDRPLNILPNDIEYYASIYVYDSHNGNVIWEGRLEDPGRMVSPDGQTWAISAVGPRAHTADRTITTIYVDKSLDRWNRSHYSSKNAYTAQGEVDDGTNPDVPSLDTYATEGSTISTAWNGDWIYRDIKYTGQTIARVRADHVEDSSASNWKVSIFARIDAGSAVFGKTWVWTTTASVAAAQVGDTDDTANTWGTNINVTSFRTQRDVSAVTANDSAKAHFYNITVRSVIYNADGTMITAPSSYAVNNIDPVEVIADLLGRYLTKYDGANAILIGSGVDIDQLAYPDPVTCEQILEDIGVFDPGFYWAAWESSASTGKYRFEYKPWPSNVRYEATIQDGFDSPSSATELYNAVVVRWLNAYSHPRNTRVTQTVAELTAAGITREAHIDLSDELGSSAAASRVGANFLVEHQYPANAGTLRIARPILDQDTGRMVQPYEIRPGYLIRVRGVLPRVDSLNPTARDGVTIFKVVSATYDSSDASVTLELDTHSRTVARALANLKGRRLRKR